MPFIQVSSITQTDDGYLWTAGYAGVAVFDGLQFKSREINEHLIHANVQVLYSEGNHVYVGTTQGVSVFEGTEHQMDLNRESGLQDDHIVAVTGRNNYIAFLHREGLTFLDKNNGELITANVPQNSRLRSMAVYNDTLWVSGISGLYYYDEKDTGLVKKFKNERLAVPAVCTLDGLLLGSNRGILKYKNGKLSVVRDMSSGLKGRVVTDVIHYKKGVYYAATEAGLNHCDSTGCELIHPGSEKRSNQINCFYGDDEGNLWLGTDYGLYKIVGEAFRQFDRRDGLPEAFVYGITSDGSGNTWAATDRGLYKYSGSGFTGYTQMHGILSNRVRDVFYRNDTLYMGTLDGLTVKTGNTFVNYDFKNTPEVSSVHSITENNNGELILCTQSGFGVFKNGKYTPLLYEPNEKYDVWGCVHDRYGRYIISTYEGGVKILAGDSLEQLHLKYELRGKQYLALHEDYNGNVWIGSFGGLYFFRSEPGKEKFIRITENDGLNSDLIYALTNDGDSNLWVGTNQGISRIHLPSFYDDEPLSIVTFGLDDGFTGVECNVNGAYFDHQYLWFGTVNGLMRFEPDRYRENQKPPKTMMTGIDLFYSDTLLQSGCELEYDENHLTFSFLGLSLTNPDKVRYRFMLEGYDNEWTPPGYRNKATYSGLKPGEYRFKVIAGNNFGVWNEVPVTFDFKIKQPYWQMLWFRGLVGLASVLIVFLIVRERIKRVKIKVGLEKSMDALKLKSLRSQMNPHFIFNSMNSIQYFINRNERREANKYLSKFASLMRKMLNNSRMEFVTLDEDIQALKLYLELEQMRFEDKFEYEITIDDEVAPDTEIPPMIIQPFVENAVIHGFSGIDYKGRLSVKVNLGEDDLPVCTIEDNGIGYKAGQAARGAKNHKSAATGITKERLDTLAELHNKKLSLSIADKKEDLTSSESGTIVTIKFPHSE